MLKSRSKKKKRLQNGNIQKDFNLFIPLFFFFFSTVHQPNNPTNQQQQYAGVSRIQWRTSGGQKGTVEGQERTPGHKGPRFPVCATTLALLSLSRLFPAAALTVRRLFTLSSPNIIPSLCCFFFSFSFIYRFHLVLCNFLAARNKKKYSNKKYLITKCTHVFLIFFYCWVFGPDGRGVREGGFFLKGSIQKGEKRKKEKEQRIFFVDRFSLFWIFLGP
jgi:uncharacterized membrane protein YhaH (DUF805 family)